MDRIKKGNLSKEDLTIRQRISRKPSKYKVNSYQAVAARQLENSGVVASAGKNVRYIILDAGADPAFPERKVILSDLYDEKRHHYDTKKYVEILKRAFENLFPIKFPELDEFLNDKDNQKFIQKNLSCFLSE